MIIFNQGDEGRQYSTVLEKCYGCGVRHTQGDSCEEEGEHMD